MFFAQNDKNIINGKVDYFINEQMKRSKIPGMAIAVIKNGKIIKKTAYGFANPDWKNKVTEHTNFQIASCTKILTLTLLLKTMYDKKISLEDSVSIKTGSKKQYGQSDFMVLSYIFEKIYNKPLVQILKDELTSPLNMNDGAFDMEYKVNGQFLRTDIIPEKVTTYYDLNGKMQAYKYLYPQYTYPAGGYFASIDDMANWAIGLDKEIQFPNSFSENYIYKTDKIDGKDADFSKVGWAVGKEDVLYSGHSGGPGLSDILRFPKEGYTIITLSNDSELLPGFSRAIASFYIKELSPKLKIEKFERD